MALEPSDLARRHFRIGWIALCIFVVFGTALEGFHGFKAAFYLDVGNESRRLLWTLAHAHGIGLSLIHIAYAATLALIFEATSAPLRTASQCVTWASALIPLGFFLGGFGAVDGDAGVGVFLAPLGAFVLLAGSALVARETLRSRTR